MRRAAAPVPDPAGRRSACGASADAYASLPFARPVSDDVKSFAASLTCRTAASTRASRRRAGSTTRPRVMSLALIPLRRRRRRAGLRPAGAGLARPDALQRRHGHRVPGAHRRDRQRRRCRGCCRPAERRLAPTAVGADAGARRRTSRATSSTCASSAAWRARTLALYARGAARGCRRFAADAGVDAARGAGAPRAALGGAAARAAAWRRAASRSCCRPGAASTAGWGRAGPGRRQPGRRRARAEGAPSRCPRRCRSTRRWRWPSTAASRRRPGAARRATTASSSCSTAAACASASWSGSTSRPAARRAGWIDARRRQRARARQGQQAAQRAGGRAGAGGAAALAGAARRRWRRADEPALFVSRRGTRLTRQPGALAPEARWRCRPACRPTCTRTCCATALPRTCCSPAATCARCRSCWATPTSRPRRSTRSSTSSTWPRSTTRRIRARAGKQSASRRAAMQSRHESHHACAKARSARCCAATPGCSRAASPAARPTPARRCASRRTTAASWPGAPTARARRSACAPGASTRPSASTPPSSSAASRAAVALRARLPIDSDGVRLVHGEADGLPGPDRRPLRATRCARSSCPPAPSAGRTAIADALLPPTGCRAAVRALRRRRARARGPAAGDRLAARRTAPPRSRSASTAGGSTLDVADGHKTGFYLDQRDNRQRFADTGAPLRLRARAELLLLHRRLHAWRRWPAAPSEVTSVDSSAPALERAAAHVALNGFDAARHRTLDADVNQTLRALLDRRRALRRHRARPAEVRADGGARRARRARLQGHQPAGASCCWRRAALLFTFSCSGGIGAELFHKIVAGAGLDAGVDGVLLRAPRRPRPTTRRRSPSPRAST